MLDTETPDHTPFPSFEGDIQYIAPELLDPATFGLPDRKPTRKGDIYAFGMVSYQVNATVGLTSGTPETNGIDQGHHNATTVLWGQGPDEHTWDHIGVETKLPVGSQRVAFGQRLGHCFEVLVSVVGRQTRREHRNERAERCS